MGSRLAGHVPVVSVYRCMGDTGGDGMYGFVSVSPTLLVTTMCLLLLWGREDGAGRG